MVRLYTPLVYRWCARFGVQGADADDVTQEVFQAAAAHLTAFRRDRDGDTFRGWMRGITHNRVKMYFRRRGRQPVASGGTDAQLLLEEVAAAEPNVDDTQEEMDGLRRRALELIRAEFEERSWRMFWQVV